VEQTRTHINQPTETLPPQKKIPEPTIKMFTKTFKNPKKPKTQITQLAKLFKKQVFGTL